MTARPAPDRATRHPKESDPAWSAAVDWLINSRWVDPDAKAAFWGIVDGELSAAEADAL